MFVFVICVALYFIPQPVTLIDITTKSSDKYGPFVITISEVEACHGPKTVDQGVITCNLSRNDGDIIGKFHYKIFKAVKFDEIKITVYNLKNNLKNMMWNYKITDPCKHFAIGPVLAVNLKAEKCLVKPGTYIFEINITEITRQFFGDFFFYGDYFFKTTALSKTGNLACLMFHQVFEKKV